MHKREVIALTACLLSAAGGAYIIAVGKHPAWTVFNLACVWSFTADWLGKRLWLLGLSPGGIRDQAKYGTLSLEGLPKVINIASLLLFGASIVLAVSP